MARRRFALAAAGGSFGLSALLLVAAVVFTLMPAGEGRRDPVLTQLSLVLGLGWLLYSAIGVIVAVRRPDSAIGWLFCAIGLVSEPWIAAGGYAGSAAFGIGGSLVDNWLVPYFYGFWQVSFALVLILLLLVPEGRLLSGRWRPIVWLALLQAIVGPLSSTPNVGPDAIHVSVLERLGADGVAIRQALAPLGALNFLAIFPLAAISIVLRFRRSSGVPRQQLKWIAYACFVLGIALPLSEIVFTVSGAFEPDAHFTVTFAAGTVLFMAGWITLPAATAVAIFRYRLYDIDLLINRTLVYGATTAAIAGTFFLGILALQTLLRPLTSGSELAVAASTLVSFALFQPVRRRVQDAVDRRFNRSRYDAARTLDAFADRLRDEVDLDALRADLLSAVGETMAPAAMSLWLRERPG